MQSAFPGPTGREDGRSLHGAALGLLLTCSYLCGHLSEAGLMADLAELSAAWFHACNRRRRATSVFFHTRRGNPPLAHGSQAPRLAV